MNFKNSLTFPKSILVIMISEYKSFSSVYYEHHLNKDCDISTNGILKFMITNDNMVSSYPNLYPLCIHFFIHCLSLVLKEIKVLN